MNPETKGTDLMHLANLIGGPELDLADARRLEDSSPRLDVRVHLHHLRKQTRRTNGRVTNEWTNNTDTTAIIRGQSWTRFESKSCV